MNRLLLLAGLVFFAALFIAVPQPVRAQFETPNRSFHEATAFRLEGRHLTLPCASCHLNGQYQGTPTTCSACHWERRRDDKYLTRLGSECEQCHRPVSWSAVRWEHASATGIPLNASHRTLNCVSCHRDGNFNRGMVLCASCHRKDYDATKSPSHAAAGFSLNCESCHRPSDPTWRTGGGSDFNHNAVFPLLGVHATVGCTSCHRSNVYKGTGRECLSCHQDDYNATRNPGHAGAGFSTACETCHRPTDPAWRGGGGSGAFNHNAVFQLVGVHATQACASCHRNNVFRGTARQCVGCHQADYNATRSPNHVSAGFSTACETCHRATDPQWQTGAPFNHNAIFPLVGVHATQACATCHRNNVFRGTARECIGCHQADYNATRSPNHVSAGFSTACETCHRATDSQWRGVTFNHNAVFPLVGTHASQACASCHRNNVFKGTARSCVGCHQGNYNATRNPNHASTGFPTTCESCHRATDSNWNQGRFSHTWFPLTGPHNRPCAQCHTTANVFSQFSCTTCHARGETDSKHREERGYRYDSAACYSCHPNGRQ
jgi:hypothetical protein